jgi:hypothetical protein
MNLAEQFEGIHRDVTYRQNEQDKLDKALKLIEPLVRALQRIKLMSFKDAGEFSVRVGRSRLMTGDGTVFADELSVRDNFIRVEAGLVTGDRYHYVPRTKDDKKFVRPLVRCIRFKIYLDGSAEVVREDKPRQGWDESGYSGERVKVSNVTQIMPILASWIQDNVPEAVRLIDRSPERRELSERLYPLVARYAEYESIQARDALNPDASAAGSVLRMAFRKAVTGLPLYKRICRDMGVADGIGTRESGEIFRANVKRMMELCRDSRLDFALKTWKDMDGYSGGMLARLSTLKRMHLRSDQHDPHWDFPVLEQ